MKAVGGGDAQLCDRRAISLGVVDGVCHSDGFKEKATCSRESVQSEPGEAAGH